MRGLVLKTLVGMLNTILTICNQLIAEKDFDTEEAYLRTYSFKDDAYKFWDYLNSINTKR